MTKSAPIENATPWWREGYEAASRKILFIDCPYNFRHSGCMAMPSPSGQELFNREYRHKMNDWFSGWKAWLDEHDLGFNFEPKKHAKDKRK